MADSAALAEKPKNLENVPSPAPLGVLVWPDAVLTTPAVTVTAFDAALGRFVEAMFATMYDANGIGLAANQVGVLQRVLVIDLDPDNERLTDPEWAATLEEWGFAGPVALVNPSIVASEGELTYEEGCLSVPGVQVDVVRKARVVVRAQTASGESFELRASGLFSVALQHEMDHLDGKVFVDYLEPDLREEVRTKMVQLKSV